MCKVLILCGGKGTRLGETGKIIPKTLIDFNGKPFIYHKIKCGINQGYKEYIIAVGYKSKMVINACNNMDLDCKVIFSKSGNNCSMLKRIYDAKELFTERLVVTYGDSISNLQYDDLIEFHLKKNSLLTIVTAPIQSPFGLVSSNQNNEVISISEKPILHYYIGTFVIEKKSLNFITKEILNWPDGDGLIAFFKIMIAINGLYTYVHDGPDITFNTIEELDAAKQGFLKFYTHFL